jgi:hypothetical protein
MQGHPDESNHYFVRGLNWVEMGGVVEAKIEAIKSWRRE